jgi:ankyrin repeat protein
MPAMPIALISNYYLFQPNAATDDDVTPLLTAAAAGSSEIVEVLLKVVTFGCFHVVLMQ